MGRIGLLILTCLFYLSTWAQSPIGGTINDYDELLTRGPGVCGDSIVVDGQMNYSVGDLLFFYNPGDATFSTGDNSSFGDSLNLNTSGRYKFAYVSQVNTPLLTLDRSIGNDFGAGTMIVKVPELGHVEATSDLTAPDYNNGVGGVFVLRADRLKLTSDIVLNEAGFKGGNTSRNMGVGCSNMGYVFPALNNGGAPKGQGITSTPTTMANGRGHILNGGGGGNNHNAGGGGAASSGAGGNGGDEWGGCASTASNGGLGGQPLIETTGRLFLGGGGGSGHNNVSGLSSEGGNGGGLVVLLVDTLEANGGEIFVNGGDGKSMINSGAEGAGGGGAGGTVFLSFKMVVGMIASHLEGGDGGDVTGGNAGPGGGGGGGFLYASDPAASNYSAGVIQGFSLGGLHGNLSNGTAYGSTDGTNGSMALDIIPNYPVPFATSGGGNSNFLGNDTTICALDSLLLSAPPGATSYLWSTGDTSSSIFSSGAGTYWVQYSNGGCLFSDTIRIQTFSGGTGSFLGPDKTLCADSSINISTTINGTYIWSTGETSQSINVNSGGWYWLNVKVGNACPVRDSIFISVDSFPRSAIVIDTAICAGASYTLDYPSDYLAFWPDGSAGQSYDFKNDGAFEIRVQNDKGCVRFDSVYIELLSNDSIFDLFDPSDTTVCLQYGYELNFMQLPGDVFWSDGRGSKIRTLYRSGTYILRYEGDCLTIRDTLTLVAEDCDTCEFFLPNAFSPNGDGLNDIYNLKSYCDFEEFELSISDRWGEQVFYSNDPSFQWDGTFKGKDCSEGVYIYDLIYKLPFKFEVRKQGSLMLIH